MATANDAERRTNRLMSNADKKNPGNKGLNRSIVRAFDQSRYVTVKPLPHPDAAPNHVLDAAKDDNGETAVSLDRALKVHMECGDMIDEWLMFRHDKESDPAYTNGAADSYHFVPATHVSMGGKSGYWPLPFSSDSGWQYDKSAKYVMLAVLNFIGILSLEKNDGVTY